VAAVEADVQRKGFDYIVVGAGSAGCIVAARLSEDPSRRVLLIEAGGSDRSPIIQMPAALPYAYQSRRLGWGYQSGPEPELFGRVIDEKRGRVFGGTSSINAMIYNRGNPLDFEGWAARGLPDWDYAHCLPYFRKMESFSGGADAWRGGDGPMRITRCRAAHKLYDCFLRAGEQASFEVTPDHNGYRQEGLHVAQAFIGDGLRWTTARGHLHEPGSRSNLTIWRNALVRRVVIRDGAATGALVARAGDAVEVSCEREIVLCAGAFNSPQLLMLSGVGDADALRTHGIEIKAHLPEVGRNLENHPGVNIQFATRHSDSLVAELGPIGRARLAAEWLLRKQGLGASNFFEAGAFLRSRGDVAFPNVQFEFLPLVRFVKDGKLRAAPGFQFWVDLSRPESRGAVRLRSADPTAAPSIVFNHLAERQDLLDLVSAVRLARHLVAQAAWDGIRGREILPGPDVTSDAALEKFVRANLGTSYHPSGTCRMGSDPDAVVDAEGRVRGVDRLRVVDASIMPRIVTANLSAAIMMMAEKISDRLLGRPALPPSGAEYFGQNSRSRALHPSVGAG
jgi:choline dehydrogenase